MYGFFTIQGREIFIGGTPDAINGQNVKITYYGEVPVFSDQTTSWVYTKYPSLYLYALLMHADLHAVGEEDKAGLMKQLAEEMINKLNAQHAVSRASGSRVTRSPDQELWMRYLFFVLRRGRLLRRFRLNRRSSRRAGRRTTRLGRSRPIRRRTLMGNLLM